MALAFDHDFRELAPNKLTPLQQRRSDLAEQIAKLRKQQQDVLGEIRSLGDALEPAPWPFLRALGEIEQAKSAERWDVVAYLEWVLPGHRHTLDEAQAQLTELHLRLGNQPGSFQNQLSELEAEFKEVTLACIAEAEQKPRHLRAV